MASPATAIVLAAGAGTRMKSRMPKVAHQILGKALVRWVIDAAHEAGIEHIITVVGHEREQVIPLVESDTQVLTQEQRDGTAGAVAVCTDALHDAIQTGAPVVVLSGDSPLVTPETITRLVDTCTSRDAAVVALTMQLENPFGYGRILRDADGSVLRIVEEKDASPQEAAIHECNAGFYCFNARDLFAALAQVNTNNAQGERYLTDVLEICRASGRAVLALQTDAPQECLGVNSRAQLAEATKVMQRRINARHLANGVTMWDPDQVWIGAEVTIEPDVELLPQCFLLGATHISRESVIGPNTRLTDTNVGEGCRIDETVALSSQIDAHASCGPRAYLRPGTHLCEGAKAGTHVELKKSTIGKNSKVPHLSYIGDASVGENVNIGAGSITCNYDGKNKWQTTVGDKAFIGSDTMLVAPVSIGAGAVVGAGSCITKDVSADALAIERAEQHEISGWARKRREDLGIE